MSTSQPGVSPRQCFARVSGPALGWSLTGVFCKQSWEILMWTLPYPSSLSLEQPSPACISLPDGCFPCEVFHDCEDHRGLLHQMPSLHRLARSAPGFLLSSRVLLSLSLPPLFSFSLHLLPSTFTSQSVVPSLATSQIPPWPADTGSESASRYLGDSGQILSTSLATLSPTPPYFLTV